MLFSGAVFDREANPALHEIVLFGDMRDDTKLEGKCGLCEFRFVCLGCRARAYGMTNNFLAEEPFCIYQPKATEQPGVVS